MIAERRESSVSLQPPRPWAQCRSRTFRSGVVSRAAELSISVQALQVAALDLAGMPWRLLTLLLTGQLLASMDASILTVATPVLQRELDASPTMLQAIYAAYTFTFGVLVVTGARLGDDRGHGNMFLAGLAGFTASSLVCGLAPSAPVLLAGRLVQGACGALMTPQTLQVIQRRFDGDGAGEGRRPVQHDPVGRRARRPARGRRDRDDDRLALGAAASTSRRAARC